MKANISLHVGPSALHAVTIWGTPCEVGDTVIAIGHWISKHCIHPLITLVMTLLILWHLPLNPLLCLLHHHLHLCTPWVGRALCHLLSWQLPPLAVMHPACCFITPPALYQLHWQPWPHVPTDSLDTPRNKLLRSLLKSHQRLHEVMVKPWIIIEWLGRILAIFFAREESRKKSSFGQVQFNSWAMSSGNYNLGS